jgi:Rrf2 family protein
VKPNKSTRYALYAAMEMAAATPDTQVTAGQVAKRYKIPGAVLAKVFQQLVRAGLAVGTRGTKGGYRLARSPANVTMLDVIQVFQPPRPLGECMLMESRDQPCADPDACRLRTVFDEVDGMVRRTFSSITLAALVGDGAMPELGPPKGGKGGA